MKSNEIHHPFTLIYLIFMFFFIYLEINIYFLCNSLLDGLRLGPKHRSRGHNICFTMLAACVYSTGQL